ncbi:family 43 glycosylhydrolase [Fodinicola acaciae]|uniref:family 43 glycosylhydrolase n=1 Tax=Fodinicola acaciae TaxID=2681555 RepID=UPI0013D2917A|nr:family 43 glycosylhydrolase [Fodinicola acaciae]
MKSMLLCLAVTATVLGATAPAVHAATVGPSLVINQDFPDPDVLQVGSTFYAYSTSSGAGRTPVASAPSATGPWTIRGDALPTPPSWAGGGGFWAPDVSRRSDGTYLMYFTGPSAAVGRMCVGAAVSTNPLGPFTPVGDAPLVCDGGEGGDIDPSSFVDTDGKRYLLYKNDGNAIGQAPALWLQPVAADGVTFTGSRTALLRADRADEANVIEAPVLVHRPSQYVLFYSAGNYGGSGYYTSYAVSPSITGSYSKAYRPLITTDSVDGAVVGPGGEDVVGDRIFFHGWLNGGRDARGMYVADLGWANDYPVVRGSRVRYEAERGTLNDCRVRTGAAGASQGAVAAYIDNDDSWVDITVFAPTAGNYTAHVAYAAGYGDAQHQLTVNGSAQQVVDYPDHGWDNWTQVGVGVDLNAGWNTLRFQHLTRWAELDFVEIA